MSVIQELEPHDKPPEALRNVYKKYQKFTPSELQSDPTVLDFQRGLTQEQQKIIERVDEVQSSAIDAACLLLGSDDDLNGSQSNGSVQVYQSKAIPGKCYKMLAVKPMLIL